MREFDKQPRHCQCSRRRRGRSHTRTASGRSAFALVADLAQKVFVIAFDPHSLFADLWTFPLLAPFLSLAVVSVRIATSLHRRRRIRAGSAELRQRCISSSIDKED